MPRGSFSTRKLKSSDTEPYAPALSVKPTDEQAEAVRLFKAGGDLTIEALAGTGKTTALRMIGESTKRKGQYCAFNRQIVLDAASRMPSSVACKTVHSLAMASIGWKYSARINGPSPKFAEVAAKLGLKSISLQTPFSKYRKLIEPWKLVGFCRNAVLRYCQSGDRGITTAHFPYIEGLDEPDDFTNNEVVKAQLLEPARKFWADWQNPSGFTKYDQSGYLKMWELSSPKIAADFILVDEAADLNGVMISIIAQQAHAQKILTGDSNQAINEWMGSINALERVKTDNRCELTQSFRSGAAVTDIANKLLTRLGTKMRLQGHPDIVSEVRPLTKPKAILSRSNAAAVAGVLLCPSKSHLIGGGTDVIRFAEEAQKLRGGSKSTHHDLVCFDTWDELKEYVNSGHVSDLALLVALVEKFGGKVIADGLKQMPTIDKADTIYSTTHKVKGLEFDSVQIAPDFERALTERCVCDHTIKSHMRGECFGCTDQGKECANATKPVVKPIRPAELRLVYVGVTRAKTKLDISAIEGLI